MSTVGVTPANTEYDAAQALLDLQSNNRNTTHDRKDAAETAKLFLSCFITSNVGKQSNKTTTSPKVGTVSPMYAIAKSTPIRSEVNTSSYIPKRKTPDQEITREPRVDAYHSTESGSKRSKIFKRKPIKHFTVTSGPLPDIVVNKITNSNRNLDVKNNSETKVKTHEIGTQTEDKYQLPIIETMEFTITKLCEKIKTLEAQIKSNSRLMLTIDQDGSDNEDYDDDDDDDESYKVDSNDMTMDDSNEYDSDMNETFTDCYTPEKSKRKHKKSSPEHGYNTAKVLSNRNVNANADDMVPIGDGNAMIPSRIFRHINWNSYTSATRKLLTAVFSRRILATHSLTGKPSPAFPNKPAKKKLDSSLVNDIVQTVVERCCVPENVVRTSITTKCADESKMFRTRQQNKKKKRKNRVNRENIPPDSDSEDY